MKKVLLVDFSAIKSGGGVQLAVNFIECILEFSEKYSFEIVLLLPNTGPLSKYHTNSKFAVIVTPNNIFLRTIYEYTFLALKLKRMKISCIYTFFGAGLPHSNKVKSFVSVAYPIICYDNSPFWKKLNRKSFIKQKIINYFRKKRLNSASVIFAETEVMKRRLSHSVPFLSDNIIVIPPSVTKYVEEGYHGGYNGKILVLSGLSCHKNVEKLYYVASYLIDHNFLEFKFVISCKKMDFIEIVKGRIDKEILDNHFEFLGCVDSTLINSLYKEVDMLINLSDLESFSNNYMESWKAGVPLIVSDRDFSRHICKESAIYVDPYSVESVSESIIRMARDSKLRNECVQKGKQYCLDLPSLEFRIDKIFNILIDG